jgi:uncharacterized protein involved in exopolysaccharide biosynthesis/Mrp family chromosome partitioning ATPase
MPAPSPEPSRKIELFAPETAMLLAHDKRDPAPRFDNLHAADGEEIANAIGFVKRNIALMVITVAAAVGLWAVYAALVPPRFLARTTLLLDVKKPRAVQDQDAIPNNVAELGYVESQVVVLQSSATIERVVDKLKLYNDPEFNGAQDFRALLARVCPFPALCPAVKPTDDAARLRDAIERLRQLIVVQRIGASQVIEVSVTLHDKDKAAAIANSVVDSYMEVQTAAANRLTREAISWLEQRIEELRRQALDADRRLQEFKSGGGGPVDPGRRAFMLRELLSTSENQQALYQGFLTRYAQTAQQLSFPLSDVRVLTTAAPPSRPAGLPPAAMLAIAALSGLLLGVGWAAARERLDKTIKTPEQLETLTGLACLATLPTQHGEKRSKADGSGLRQLAKSAQRRGSPHASGMSLLLARLETRLRENGSVVVGVGSIGQGADQASVAANLAYLSSALGRSTLLIDADWPQAKLSGRFAPGASIGAMRVAAERASIGAGVQVDEQSGLAFLPARSRIDAEPADPVTCPDWIAYAVAQAKEGRALVIVNLPDCLSTGDVHRGLEEVDELILVCAAAVTTVDDLRHCLRDLRGFEQRITGCVLTGVQAAPC